MTPEFEPSSYYTKRFLELLFQKVLPGLQVEDITEHAFVLESGESVTGDTSAAYFGFVITSSNCILSSPLDFSESKQVVIQQFTHAGMVLFNNLVASDGGVFFNGYKITFNPIANIGGATSETPALEYEFIKFMDTKATTGAAKCYGWLRTTAPVYGATCGGSHLVATVNALWMIFQMDAISGQQTSLQLTLGDDTDNADTLATYNYATTETNRIRPYSVLGFDASGKFTFQMNEAFYSLTVSIARTSSPSGNATFTNVFSVNASLPFPTILSMEAGGDALPGTYTVTSSATYIKDGLNFHSFDFVDIIVVT